MQIDKKRAGLARSFLVLRLDDAFYRANVFAARGIEVADALDTGVGVNHVDGITFGNRLGGAFRQARATGNAVVLNLHSHSSLSMRKI